MSKEFENIISFENLYRAHRRARLGKRHKKEVIEFEMNLSENLWALHNELKYSTYKVSGYHNFMIYDPKEREIQAITYRDRIVQHSLCDNYLTPLIERHLIFDNAACRKGKGTHFAIRRLRQFMTKHYKNNANKGYFVKIDVKKYFSNIDHKLLKLKLYKLKIPSDILSLLYGIIDSYQHHLGSGLPMGNQTSQAFALLYLNGIDRVIKEDFQIKYYIRYMDDLIMVVNNKTLADTILEKITGLLNAEQLPINPKSQVIPIKNGISFLGWTFSYGQNGAIVQKPKKSSKARIIAKVKDKIYLYNQNAIALIELYSAQTSYKAHLQYGNSHNFSKSITKVFAAIA
ncbi:reverse transcriptase [bacterium]|nr:reverse transcriptase [bacterium]